MTDGKWCATCRHVDRIGCLIKEQDWKCDSPKNKLDKMNVLTGEPQHKHKTCTDNRMLSCADDGYACYLEGYWWEPNYTLAQHITGEARPRSPKGKITEESLI